MSKFKKILIITASLSCVLIMILIYLLNDSKESIQPEQSVSITHGSETQNDSNRIEGNNNIKNEIKKNLPLLSPQSQNKTVSSSTSFPMAKEQNNALQSPTEEKDMLPVKAEMERIKKSVIYNEWMVTVEATLGDSLTDEKKKAIKDQEIKLLHGKQILQNQYYSEELSWNEYVTKLEELLHQDQSFYQKNLSDEEYEKLYNCKKGEETTQMVKGVMTPSDNSEALILFPEIKENDPTVKNEADLYQKVDKYRLEQLMKLDKQKMKDQQSIQSDFEAGVIKEDDYSRLMDGRHEQFIEDARHILEPKEFQLIFGDSHLKKS